MAEIKAVEFEYQIRQVKTMSDHSFNITINLPEYCADQVGIIMRHIDDAGHGILTFEDSEERMLHTLNEMTGKTPTVDSLLSAGRITE